MNTKYKISLFVLAVLIIFSACETVDLDVNDDPNNATPEASDITLLTNGAMLNFSKWISEEDEDNRAGFEAGMEVVRMLHMYGPLYDNAYEPGDFDDIWRQAYAGHLVDIKTIKEIGTETGLLHHVGVAQVLESYTLTTLVDYFGDIPYTQALQGAAEFNPIVDDDAEVYAIALTLLDNAIANLESEPPTSIASTGDVFFFGNISKWITLAKTLKLRIYNNTRLVDPAASQAGINALLADGDIIDEASEDFSVFFGSQSSAPDIRHPQFINNYENTPSGEYMSMYFMNLLVNGFDSGPDPRLRYYIYRQVEEFPEADAQGIFDFPCLAESYPTHYTPGVDPFCTSIGSGYWGRIHGDAQGLPSDSDKISTWGTYPIGGTFDNNSFSAVTRTSGMGGAGIQPVILSSYVYFIRAEAALELGTNDDAATMLEAGMRASFDKVINFDPTTIGDPFAATSGDVDDYIADILADFGAASEEEKLNIIMTQAYIAAWGNPVEPYNNYRRTGMPLEIQPTQSANPGVFIHSFKYPSVAIDNNPNINPKENQGIRVFWDLNTTNLDF
ncbi:SusD/RagB family nutrient-binding outer membrane lipoprotein [Abyssalbus ytuae]|uniref:SusD/RagB family nutrient-binding outer membrane lipoprotein n=1 Tax=Abyssalbus ytuae TaxID=2926907 RepID=A0A9E7CTL1_9FLAO|nr:SusD/RagB family nutrient-binding outer membrane lipoprotein [Abyssalbus ytuae]UOB16377.1 SusD/RagB family nutrient-binding outer membrane lipoprotein [Abyssalbus ytuae]